MLDLRSKGLCVAVLASSIMATGRGAVAVEAEGRHRVCVLTDLGGDPDDEQSLLRFIACANQYDIEGLVMSPFVFTRPGRSDSNPVHAVEHVGHLLDAYDEVRPQLDRHAAFAGQTPYPPAESIMRVTAPGVFGFTPQEFSVEAMQSFIGDMGDHVRINKEVMKGKTPGSRLIVEILAKDDPRPVDFSIWGGGATLQQAILEIENDWAPWHFSRDEKDRMFAKIRVFSIKGQDFSDPLFFQVPPWKERITYIDCDSFFGMHHHGDRSTLTRAWVDEHIAGHGPLGVVGEPTDHPDIRRHPFYPYVRPPTSDDSIAMKEGDTPAFLGLMANGLSFPDDPRADDWSGRYRPAEGRLWTDPDGGGDQRRDASRVMEAIARWRPAFNADFRARMDWMKEADVRQANHHPRPAFRGETHPNNAPVRLAIDATRGATIALDADGSTDPDGDALSFHWERDLLLEGDDGTVRIALPDARETILTLDPRPSKDVHVILAVTDDGEPNLTMYRRIIIGPADVGSR